MYVENGYTYVNNLHLSRQVLALNCTDRDGSLLEYRVFDDDHFYMNGKELQIKKSNKHINMH